MVLEDYIALLEAPDSISSEDVADLQAMLSYAPYCQSANILLAYAMFKGHDTSFSTFLPKAVLHAPAPREAWYILHPKAIVRKAVMHSQGDYFSFVNHMQQVAAQTGTSFLELAQKFQESRQGMLQQQEEQKSEIIEILPEEKVTLIKNDPILQNLIALRDENLRNPKKSIYFADQIRFLDKAIALREAKITNR